MHNDKDHFPGTLAVIGLDGQALAQSAARGGLRPVVIDHRGSADLGRWSHARRRIGRTDRGGLDNAGLLAAIEQLCPEHACLGIVYGPGFATDPSLLERISAGKRLYGNSPDTLQLVSDPGAFFPLLDSLAIPHPAVGGDLPPNQGPWLLKKIGAHGGRHIRMVQPGQGSISDGTGSYYQQRVSGRSLTVVLIADGQRCRILGVSERWTIPKQHIAHNRSPFLSGGAISDAPIERRLRETLQQYADGLTLALGLVGINELEVLASGDQAMVLGLDPFPGTGLSLYDHRYPGGLFAHHLRACRGQLPVLNENASMARGHSFVYLPGPVQMPRSWRWPWWSCNYHPRDHHTRQGLDHADLKAGEHLCTVHASGANPVSVRARLRQREHQLLTGLMALRITARMSA